MAELVRQGRVSESRIDEAVRRILRTKMRLGLFDQPITAEGRLGVVGSAEHRAVARQCVRESLGLLKNERGVLPLSRRLRHIHLLGEAADDPGIRCGGGTISWQGAAGRVTTGGTTLLEAVRAAAGASRRVTHGADLAVAAGADLLLVVVAEPPYAQMRGDRADLSLPEDQVALVQRARSTGKPVVTILYSGWPLLLGSILEHSDAFIAAWLPGTEGQGIADVLFGVARPVGRLPRIWPRDNRSLNTLEAGSDVLFPRGYGLTYSHPRLQLKGPQPARGRSKGPCLRSGPLGTLLRTWGKGGRTGL